MELESKNILTGWMKEAIWLSSQINPNKTIRRGTVHLIYDSLVRYFGIDYFDPNFDISNRNDNWIYYLLGRRDSSGIQALADLSKQLEYLLTLERSIQDKLKSVIRQPGKFRELMFEIYVFSVLDVSGVVNNKKVDIGGVEVEGEMVIDAQYCIFECNRPYSTKQKEIAKLKSLSGYLFEYFQNFNIGLDIHGRFEVLNLGKDVTGKLASLLGKYKKQLRLTETPTISYIYEDEDAKLVIEPFSSTKYAIDKGANERTTIFFKMVGPSTITNMQKSNFRVELEFGLKFSNEDANKKLLANRGYACYFQTAPLREDCLKIRIF